MDKEKCLSCEKEISADSNFCSHCGKKQKSVCNCWVKEKPYRGGENMVANIEREWEEKYKPAIAIRPICRALEGKICIHANCRRSTT